MKRVVSIIAVTMLLHLLTSAQAPLSKVDLPQIITPSPEAAALGKYGDVPVSLFSGTPQIQIPIYNYRNGDLSVNIGLSYNAGGIKVDETATSVGLGWALNAGGVVTTSVLGIPDGFNDAAFPAANFNPNMSYAPFDVTPPTSDYLFAASVISNNEDLERDIYFFNFLGQSGKFVITSNGSPKIIPANPNIKITPYNGLWAYGFVITDDRGVKYYFTEDEVTTDVNYSCSTGSPSGREHDGGAPTWYLTKIKATDDREILFEYENYYYTVVKGSTETEYIKLSTSDWCSSMSAQNRNCTRSETILGLRLKKIFTSNNPTKVELGYSSSAREDLTYGGSNAGKSLDTIKVYDGSNLIKEWLFTYGYFGSGGTKRLKLLTAKEDSKPAYAFTYDETYTIPAPGSPNQDHWGYYNGASNSGLIPPVAAAGKTSGANRDANFSYMKTASLTKLLYPTGGTTAFEYEGHTHNTTIVYGGLRIKSIKDYDSVTGQLTHCKFYSYKYDGTADSSSIIIPESPSLVYNSTYKSINNGTTTPLVDFCVYAALSSSSVPIIGNGLDNMLGYKQVIVKDSISEQTLGRAIYKYSSGPSDVNATVPAGNLDWCKGHLLEQIDQKWDAVSSSFKNVKRIKNYYQGVFNQYCNSNPDSCLPTQTIIPNMKISYVHQEFSLPNGSGYGSPAGLYPGQFLVEKYYTISAVVHLAQTDETLVDTVNGNSITTTILNYYENDVQHIYPTKKETTDSRGNLIRNNLKYAFDLTGSGAVYSKMIEKNIVAPVLEETATNVTHSQQIAKKQTTYQFWNGTDSLIKPYQVLTSQKGAALETHLTISGYDDLGNMLGFIGRDSMKKTYLWDYYQQYPIAEAVKADSSQIAFTSFEAGNILYNGGWTLDFYDISSSYAITGSKSFPLSTGSITRSGLASTIYIVSYWGRNGSVNVNSASPTRTGKTVGDWTYYEHEITTTSITVSGSNYIDELRLYPRGAMMTSYTYTPLVGITSQSDVNGHIIYYEYDSYSRLKAVKDEDGKILKRMEYKYKEGSSGW